MGSTKVNSGVITAEALSKAAAEMEAILARLDDSDYEDALTIKSGDDSEPLGQNLFSDPEGSATDSDSTDTTPDATPTNQTTASSDGSTNSLPSTDTKPQNNYLLFPTPVPVSPSEPRTVQIGTLNNIPIYHYYSHAEQFLSSQEYATPFGKRFLLDEPDSLLPPEDPSDTVYHPRANSGEWWPGPGNANRHFRFKKYFEIRQSKLGGLGAYATADIEGGRVILAERPLLLTTHGKVSDDVMRMGEAARGIYKSLDGGGEVGWVRRVKDRNCFDLGGGIGFFGIASRFNHACRGAANVSYNYDHCRKVMVLSTRRDIEAGTELVIDYGAGSSACLYAMYGFVCRCSGGCRPLTRKDLVAMGAGLEDCARWGLASEKELGW
ncbi:hypothetical protein QBC41DRAFT_394035 [Cercophora samala]|uniref:SET domain-containing protein n=1 Tax=Cercophora samala TaxID=330535 RepID=A0AA39ZC35_9PEZI|nr:hypothetical protein QBC41DRAFT_394035 [Cercophora samala]